MNGTGTSRLEIVAICGNALHLHVTIMAIITIILRWILSIIDIKEK